MNTKWTDRECLCLTKLFAVVQTFAETIRIMLGCYPGEESKKILGELACFYIVNLKLWGMLPDTKGFLVKCGFDEQKSDELSRTIALAIRLRGQQGKGGYDGGYGYEYGS